MNSWQIEHQCPQCGAPILLDETDRLLDCTFCRTRLSLTANEGFHYYLPPPVDTSGKELIFLPYWRLKGASYSCQTTGVETRFRDATFPAMNAAAMSYGSQL